MSASEIEQVLGSSKFFKKLSPEAITKIASLCELNEYAAGDYIFRQGDVGEDLFVVIEGQVELERSVDLGDKRGRICIETLGRGRTLGCWSTLLDQPHVLMSSACCMALTRVVAIKGDDIRAIMEDNRELGFDILERLCFLLWDRIQAAYGALERI
jgi:CRP/FNR family transcriptional regulator, cyclic AMP receptor protein